MNIISEKIEEYATAHSKQSSTFVGEIEQWTKANSDASRMLSGTWQGAVLQTLVTMARAKRILEIGMFTGYSALTMAEAMPDDGQLVTIDIDREREAIAKSFFSKSPHGRKISIRIGDAMDVISDLDGPFDLVFIDADKTNYLNYYEAVMPMIPSGGVIVADNVLWSGEVLDAGTEDARALDEFNKRVVDDRRVINALLTVRDGLMIASKI